MDCTLSWHVSMDGAMHLVHILYKSKSSTAVALLLSFGLSCSMLCRLLLGSERRVAALTAARRFSLMRVLVAKKIHLPIHFVRL